MDDLTRELNLSGIDRLLGVDWRKRCDYCGWPLAESMGKGCVADNCSQRPRPLAMTSDAAQEIRRMEADISTTKAALAAAEAERDAVQRRWAECDKKLGHYTAALETAKRALPPRDNSNWNGDLVGCGVEVSWTIQELQESLATARAEAERMRARLTQANDGIRAVGDLIDESRGVAGLHLNGDEAPWGDLLEGGFMESWLLPFSIARAALGEKG